MRIISGIARRRSIVTPEGENTRPTGDRVREAMFNSLHSAGMIEGRRCVDLFAGSGALGLEALSRGAAHVLFVDSDRRAVRCVEENVEALDFADQSTVRSGDGLRLASQGSLADAEVALLDPPYEFEDWPELIQQLADAGIEALAIESNRSIDPGPDWEVLKDKPYGGTVVVIAQRRTEL